LDGSAPKLAAFLREHRELCENRAVDLKTVRIDGHTLSDGRSLYEKAQVRANSMITYITLALNQDIYNKTELEDHGNATEKACRAFEAWADEKLRPGAGALPWVDIASIILDLARFFDERARAQREAIKKDLKELEFRNWAEIRGAGALG